MDTPTSPVSHNTRRRLPLGGVILLIIGVLWLLQNIGYTWARGIWLPIVLIIVGLYVVAKKR